MPTPPCHHRRRRAVRFLVAAMASLSILACASAAPDASPPPPTSSRAPTASPSVAAGSPTATAPSGTPGSTEAVAVTLTELVEDAAVYDGKRVIVSGSYVGTPQGQVLCELLLESYPPQAGGAMVDLAGQLPQEVLDVLESTTDEPDLAPVTWGQVEVIGTFRAATGALEVEQIRVL